MLCEGSDIDDDASLASGHVREDSLCKAKSGVSIDVECAIDGLLRDIE